MVNHLREPSSRKPITRLQSQPQEEEEQLGGVPYDIEEDQATGHVINVQTRVLRKSKECPDMSLMLIQI